MTSNEAQLAYVTRLGDNALITGQRLLEVVAAFPELEEELANANFALDYIGQARMFYSYAAELEGKGSNEDGMAFLRDDHEFRNLLLVEQPNGHFGDTITKLVLFESFYLLQLAALTACSDPRVVEIAVRAEKEIRYHLRHNSMWLVRLGDGTDLSHRRVQDSVNQMWQYTGEMFAADEAEQVFAAEFNGPDLQALHTEWRANIVSILVEATLSVPEGEWMASGGKQGRHGEHFGFLVAEMQVLRRAHPGANW